MLVFRQEFPPAWCVFVYDSALSRDSGGIVLKHVAPPLSVWIRLHRIDECEINSLSSFLVGESSKYKASVFHDILKLCVPMW